MFHREFLDPDNPIDAMSIRADKELRDAILGKHQLRTLQEGATENEKEEARPSSSFDDSRHEILS